MPVIGLIGPHAVGKTTALKRWQSRYGHRLNTFSLDTLRKEYPDNLRKQELIERCHAAELVSVVESARGFAAWVSCLTVDDVLIVLTCPEQVERQWLVERRNGRPLSAYWTTKRLAYECDSYLRNYAQKLTGPTVQHFTMTDRIESWKAVDDYFCATFRRLHNNLKRQICKTNKLG